MLATNNAPGRAKWEVLWIKDGKVHRKDFEHDLMGAMSLWYKVKDAGRQGATLRCKNMGFPPPEDLMPQMKKYKVRLSEPKIVKYKGKRYRQTHKVVEREFQPMYNKNIKGIFWCPYCQRLRRFIIRSTYTIDKVTIGDGRLQCPMCRITTRDSNVRKFNPLAVKIFYEEEEKQVRAPSKTTKTRRAAYRRKRRKRKSPE